MLQATWKEFRSTRVTDQLCVFRKKTATWCSTVAGVLSSGCPQFFKSGQKEFNKEMGWWALMENVSPTVKFGETGIVQ